MIQTSKKSIFAFLLVIIVLINIFAVPALASGSETASLETVTIELFEEGTLIADFSSEAEFEAYMTGGISPMYVTCGTGLYWHGQFTYTKEYDYVKTTTDENGNVTILNLVYVQVYCSSCDGLIESYFIKG